MIHKKPVKLEIINELYQRRICFEASWSKQSEFLLTIM